MHPKKILKYMKKIKVLGEFELLSLYIPNSPELKGDFNVALDALHTAVSDAWSNVKKEELKAICEDAETFLRVPNLDTNFGAIVTSLEMGLDKAGRFKRRNVLEGYIAEVRSYLDAEGKGPQNPITRSLFEPVSEPALLDRSGYNDEEDLLVIISKSQNTEGLIDLVRVLPYVNARNTLIIKTDDEWIEETVEPYLEVVIQLFQDQLGVVVSVQDDDLTDKLIQLFELAQD
jgi:hypothetical protein